MSALQAGRPYMSIGELLNVLKDEFPDITVSKIRFLESEGLIHPERTPSGYRKFSSMDVERLGFILRLQRDHFLPLKVIRQRVADWEASGGADNGRGQPSLALQEAPQRTLTVASDEEQFDVPIGTGLSMSTEELERASGLEESEIRELQSFGLLQPKDAGGGDVRFTEVDLQVAKLSRELIRLGLEPRHLRMFRSSVDRWASLAEQMVLPLVKQRNPEARRAAADTVRDLVRLGNKLTQALLREALSRYA